MELEKLLSFFPSKLLIKTAMMESGVWTWGTLHNLGRVCSWIPGLWPVGSLSTNARFEGLELEWERCIAVDSATHLDNRRFVSYPSNGQLRLVCDLYALRLDLSRLCQDERPDQLLSTARQHPGSAFNTKVQHFLYHFLCSTCTYPFPVSVVHFYITQSFWVSFQCQTQL